VWRCLVAAEDVGGRAAMLGAPITGFVGLEAIWGTIEAESKKEGTPSLYPHRCLANRLQDPSEPSGPHPLKASSAVIFSKASDLRAFLSRRELLLYHSSPIRFMQEFINPSGCFRVGHSSRSALSPFVVAVGVHRLD